MVTTAMVTTDPKPGQLRRATHKDVLVANIHPNPWNYRGMSETMFEKEVQSFLTFGYLSPILVRRLIGSSTAFEIIDGEHRWKAAQDPRVGAIAMEVVELMHFDGSALDDRTAKKLTIVLNETHGDVRYDDLGKLVGELDAEAGHLDLLEQLPFPSAELKAMLALFDNRGAGHLDNDDSNKDADRDVEADAANAKTDEWEHVQFRLPPKARAAIDRAVAAITEDIAKMPKEIRLGVGIERLADEYLARRKLEGRPAPEPKKNGAPRASIPPTAPASPAKGRRKKDTTPPA